MEVRDRKGKKKKGGGGGGEGKKKKKKKRKKNRRLVLRLSPFGNAGTDHDLRVFFFFLILIIVAVISIAPYLTDKSEHTAHALYKINNKVCIKTSKIINSTLYSRNIVFPPPPPPRLSPSLSLSHTHTHGHTEGM